MFLLCPQIRTLGMLRSRFQSMPGAFNACLIPTEKDEKPKGLKATFSRKYTEVLAMRAFTFTCFILVLPVFSYWMLKIVLFQYETHWHLQIRSNKDKEAARFSQIWNKIIESFREEDLINYRWCSFSFVRALSCILFFFFFNQLQFPY